MIGEDRFHAEIAGGQMELARGSADQHDAIIETDSDTLAALIYGGCQLAEALRSGDLKVEGDKSVVKRFLTLFPLSRPAATCLLQG
ncbi:MAG: SCP2 sterol-binding domain-containing protein [Acidobacteria bacterium]|nr:SCP2 sterol-binding domain-containing protein [Acidobacteriota bacterium]